MITDEEFKRMLAGAEAAIARPAKKLTATEVRECARNVVKLVGAVRLAQARLERLALPSLAPAPLRADGSLDVVDDIETNARQGDLRRPAITPDAGGVSTPSYLQHFRRDAR